MIRWLRNLSLVTVILAISVFFVNGGAYAATNVSSSIADKAFYQAVYNCYTSGHVDRIVNPLSQYVNATNPLKFLTYGSDRSEDNIPLVSGWEGRNYKNNDNGVRCDELLNGFSAGGSYAGLMKAFGKSAPKAGDAEGIAKLVENLGYTVITSGEDKCYSLNYVGVTETLLQGEVTDSGRTNQVCQKSDGKLYVDTMGNTTRFTADGEEVCLFVASSVTHHGKCTKLGDSQFSGEWLMSVVKNACSGAECSWNDTTSGQSGTVTFDSSIEGGSQSGISLKNSSAQFINNDSWAAAKTAVSFLSDGKITSSDDMHLTELEKRLLYQAYFTDYYKAEVDCREGQSDELYDGKFNWLDSDKTIKECHYSFSKATNKDKAVNGVNTLRDFEFESIPNLEALAEEIKGLPSSYPSEEIEAAAATSSSTGDPGSQTDCMGLDLNGQGWELCPMLMNGANTADGFVFAIDEMLNVKTNLYDQESDTFKAWNVFRTFANVAMSLVLLVIIISQVTGFGINNYGIKKMLPRFVVVAILVNLSFVLCEVAVDVSNILGKGLDDLFRNLAGSFGSPTVGSGNTISDLVAGLIALLGGGGAVAALVPGVAIAAEVAAPLLIISLVLSVLVALVGILLFFVMLGARMVIVVGFIAIAPVAIVCYILPNTQVLFKKWWSIFKAALVMYPLCGLLYGLSFVIKAIFNGSGTPGLWEGVVLLITPFLPFFVLPGLLKGALAGLGAVGGALTSLGNGLKSGLQNANTAIKNSEGYKQASQFAQDQKAAKWAERVASKYNSDKYKNRELSNRQKAERLAAINIGNAQRMKEATADVGAYELSPDTANLRAQSAKSAQELRAYSDQFTQMSYGQLSDEAKNIGAWIGDDDAESHMNALLQQLTARGALTETYEMLENAGGRTKGFGTVMGSLAGSGDAVLKAYGKGGSDYADFKSFMNEGGFQKYAGNKGLGLSGIDDDKTLSYLASVEGTSNMQQLSTEQLVNVAANTNDQVAIDQIDKMLEKRTDFSISGDQLTRLNSSTIETLGQSEAGKRALSKAMEAVVNDPQLSGKLSDKLKKDIQNSIGYLPTAQSGNASGSNNLPHGFEQTDSGLIIPRNK